MDSRRAITAATNQLRKVLPEMGFEVKRVLPTARRPLITVRDLEGDMGECDVSVNNHLPLWNSELLRSYSMVNPRLRPLVLLVKQWAKKHHVCGAYHGNLSS